MIENELFILPHKLTNFIDELFTKVIEPVFIKEDFRSLEKRMTPKQLFTTVRYHVKSSLKEFIDRSINLQTEIEKSITKMVCVEKDWLDNLRYALLDSLHITGHFEKVMENVCNDISEKLKDNKQEDWQDNCWFCGKDKTDTFDIEFDTYLHINCLRTALSVDPKHQEAILMKYLLKEDKT